MDPRGYVTDEIRSVASDPSQRGSLPRPSQPTRPIALPAPLCVSHSLMTSQIDELMMAAFLIGGYGQPRSLDREREDRVTWV